MALSVGSTFSSVDSIEAIQAIPYAAELVETNKKLILV
jgi:hypothetical protein